jgi:hypothetical protein
MRTDHPSRPWRGPNKGPLTSILVPQDPQSRGSSGSAAAPVDSRAADSAVPESVKRLAVPVLLDAVEAASFDLMEIQLTVYGLTGVIASKKEARKPNRRRPSVPTNLFSKRHPTQPTTTQPTTASASNSTLEAASTSIGASQSLTSHESYEMPADDGVPVTAVVSFQRNAFSSTTSLETFLPSLPLVASSSIRPGSSYRYQASWMRKKTGNEAHNMSRSSSWRKGSSASEAESDKDACTFKVIRTMRRESYRPGVSIEDVSNYSYETVDLNVLVGHRQNLVSLGVASLVVTGDEEGENVVKIPVRQSSTKNVKGRGKGKGSSASFLPHDPEWRYSLEENATLCVGVRVVPLPSAGTLHCRDENSCVDAAAASSALHHSEPQRDRPMTKPRKKRDDPATNDVVVEVEDEAMLLAQLCRTDDSEDKRNKKKKGAKSSSRLDARTSHECNDKIDHNCTGGGDGVDNDGGAALSGMALMTMLPQGMLCVPTSLNATCLDVASQNRHEYLPKDVRDYLLPTNPKDKSKDKPRAGSRTNHAVTSTSAAHLPASLLSTLSASTDGSITETVDRNKAADAGERSCGATSSFADSHLLSVQRMIEANLHAMHAKLGASRAEMPAPLPPPPPPQPTTKTRPKKPKPSATARAPADAPPVDCATNPPDPSATANKSRSSSNNNNNKIRRQEPPAHRTLEV